MSPSALSRHLVAASLALGAWTLAPTAHAALVLVNDSVFGTDAVVQDTASGLEWLRLDFSFGKTYTYVAGQLGVGGEFEGWKIATRNFLTTSLGAPNGLVNDDADPAAVAAAGVLRDLICFTAGQCKAVSSTHDYARGLVSDIETGSPFAAQEAFTVGIQLADAGRGEPAKVDFRYSGFASAEATMESVWLWRGDLQVAVVPEPTGLALLLAGGLALGATTRRRRRQPG